MTKVNLLSDLVHFVYVFFLLGLVAGVHNHNCQGIWRVQSIVHSVANMEISFYLGMYLSMKFDGSRDNTKW